MDATTESGKDAGRIAIFAAVGTLVTYIVTQVQPGLPPEVMGAILVLVTAGLTWIDSWLHRTKKLYKGLSRF